LDPGLVLVGLLAGVILAAVLYTIVAGSARRRSQRASLSAIDFARGSFARQLNTGVPLAELLRQIVEALADTFKLDSAELWLCDGGVLTLAASEPLEQREPIPITAAEESIAANARVSGAAWAKVWLPSLVEGRAEQPMRIAPVTHTNKLFGFIVAERTRKGQSLAEETDETLEEVAREVGVAVNKARLDAALRQSVEQLRRQADELQASRGRLVVAADEERRRIERNLHDGAQQHLVALAIKARLVEQVAQKDPKKAQDLTHQIQADAAAALREALPAACRRAPLPASVEVDGVGRHAPEIESAVYFCCLEALQNAAKHAGDGASARIRVWEDAGALRFEVSDDGAGFAATSQAEGAGLINMRDRLGAVGGTLGVESGAGRGTRIDGVVPLDT
jgi:signal transduction histidine kinase